MDSNVATLYRKYAVLGNVMFSFMYDSVHNGGGPYPIMH